MKVIQGIAAFMLVIAVFAHSHPTELTLKATTGDYASCAGEYFKTSFIINNYPVYVSYDRQRLLAKQCASGYYITSLDYLSSMVAESKSDAPNEHCFGAFHFSNNGNVPVDEATWGTYVVDSSISCPLVVVGFKLVKKGSANYADCDGYYELWDKEINGYAAYINREKGRFIATSYGTGWAVTSTEYLDSIYGESVRTQGKYNFGAYRFSTNWTPNVEESLWGDYIVQPVFRRRSD